VNGKAKEVLIISSGNPSCNPRPLKEASSLARAGYAVTLLVPPLVPSLHQLDDELAAEGGFRLVRTGGTVSFQSRLLRWLACKAVPWGVQSIAALGPSGTLLRWARSHPAALVIAHNEVPQWVGLKLLSEGRLVAADFEDWHSEDLGALNRRHRPIKLLCRNERLLLQNAAYCTTTSEALSAALHARYGGRRADVLTNSFPLQARPLIEESKKPVRFFWFSQTIGEGRGLEFFLDAWSCTKGPSTLTLLGKPVAGYMEALYSRLPVERRALLEQIPLVRTPELPGVIAQYQVGLALEQESPPNKDLTISNKILQYLNAGLAVVATPTRGQAEVLAKEPKAGVYIRPGEVPEAVKTLDELIVSRRGLLERRQAARRLAEECYCWEREEPKLLRFVADALGRQGHA
jgi:glycosyltransferase involved in cell wall biosynthesis